MPINKVKERRRRSAVCDRCRSPDYAMTPPIEGETNRPRFTCGSCGNTWMYGKDGGKYAELA